MKKHQKGFMLAEVIVVSTIVITVLTSLYISFNKLYSNYKVRFKYYDANGLYAASKISNFYINPKISYGENSLLSLKDFGFTRVCIATDRFMVESKLICKITDILDKNNIDYHIFDEITPDPSTEIIEKGLSHIVNLKPHALIAVGGGSVIDAAKAIMYFCIQLKKNFIEENKIDKPYFIAIPTTAGTGSEVTNFSVITDTNTKSKIPLTNDIMLPDEAILDPILTVSVPKSVTAATAMDVLTHGIESYISINSNIFSQMYALKSIELIGLNLLKCFKDLHNMKYRNNLIEIRGVRYESVQRKIYAIHVWKIRNRYIRKMDSRAGTRNYADRRMDI